MRDDSSTAGRGRSGRLRRIAAACVVGLVTGSAAACASPGPGPDAARPSVAEPSTSPSALIAFAWAVPRAKHPSVPAGAKLIPLDSAATSMDRRTLYLGVQIAGGKCGTYDVVLETLEGQTHAGVIHNAAKGQACSAQETQVTLTVGVETPVSMQPIVDLATGKPMVAIAD